MQCFFDTSVCIVTLSTPSCSIYFQGISVNHLYGGLLVLLFVYDFILTSPGNITKSKLSNFFNSMVQEEIMVSHTSSSNSTVFNNLQVIQQSLVILHLLTCIHRTIHHNLNQWVIISITYKICYEHASFSSC